MGYARVWDNPKKITFSTPISQNKKQLPSIKYSQINDLLAITQGYYVITINDNKVMIIW